MKTVVIILSIIFSSCCATKTAAAEDVMSSLSKISISEDGRLNFQELSKKYGHKAELHEVVTEDGYILTVFHLQGDRDPVLLNHGLLADGYGWLLRGNGSMGIALADAGYDVWIANNRGTRLSSRHLYLNPHTDQAFYDYSFHEMAYDLAAAIDYVRNRTGEDQIISIGHSQGCSQHFPLLTLKPEYNEKIKLFIALAPATTFFKMPVGFQILADVGPVFITAFKSLNINVIFKSKGLLDDVFKTVCSKGLISYVLCVQFILFPLLGFNVEQLEPDFLPTFMGRLPATASIKSLAHFDQLFLRKEFSQFDYGPLTNLAKYGDITPPKYDLSKFDVKTAIFVGTNDRLVTVDNGKLLAKNLKNTIHFEVLDGITHGDFFVGRTANEFLFPKIFKLLEQYAKKEIDNNCT